MKRKINLKTAAAVAMIAFMSLPVFAQGSGGQGRRQQTEEDVIKRVERTADTLELSENQEKKILDYEMKLFKTMQKERENFDPETGDREAMRAKMMQMRDDRDKFYKDVLTEAQFKKYREIEDARRQQMQQRRGQGQGSGDQGGRGRGRSGGGGGN